jgi:hypothetical protein
MPFKLLRKKHNLNLYSNGKTFHLLTKKNIFPLLFKLAVNRYSVKIFNKLLAYPESLLMKDYQEVVDRNMKKHSNIGIKCPNLGKNYFLLLQYRIH